MRRQTVTALVSSVCLVVLAATIALVPVPFVSWGPGTPQNALGTNGSTPIVKIAGRPAAASGGQLLMVPLAVTRPNSHITLPEALLTYLGTNHDVLPREWVYPVGQSSDELTAAQVQALDTAQQDAAVAALRVAGVAVQQNPVVASVSSGGPAYRILDVGDIVETINGTVVQNPDEVDEIIDGLAVGDSVDFGIVRQGESLDVKVTTQASASDRAVPRVGATLEQGYRYALNISFAVDSRVQDESAGLMLALAVYVRVSGNDVTRGRVIAGTGTIDSTGTVGVTTGIREKLYAAEQQGATIFLVPASNCSEVRGVETRLRVVKVNKLDDAVSSLESLSTDPSAAAPTC